MGRAFGEFTAESVVACADRNRDSCGLNRLPDSAPVPGWPVTSHRTVATRLQPRRWFPAGLSWRQLEVGCSALFVLLKQILVLRINKLAAADAGGDRQHTQQQPDAGNDSHKDQHGAPPVSGVMRKGPCSIGTGAQKL